MATRTHTGTFGSDTVVGDWNSENRFVDYGIGNVVLTGGNQNDTFMLSPDWLYDTVDGGAGRDTVDYSGSYEALRIDLTEGTTRYLLPGEDNPSCAIGFLSNVENVVGS